VLKIKASFDDGCLFDLRVADLLEQYGIKDAVFFIPSNWTYVNRLHGDIPLSIKELKGLGERFAIGSHTVSHPMLTRIPNQQIYHEVVDSKTQLEELLGYEVEDFCYPRGYANPEIIELARQHYKRARNTLVGSLTPAEDPLWEYTTVHVSGKRRTEYEGTSWQAEARRLLDEAVKRSEDEDIIYHFWGHSWEIDRYYDWGEFEKFLIDLQAATT
jgi:peptidoglycan/xylan/chitin deacetylase (PgdA/CDA1 family)